MHIKPPNSAKHSPASKVIPDGASVRTSQSVDGRVTTGALSLLGSRLVFLAGAFLMHSYLGRTLGPVEYGLFVIVTTFLLWVETPLEGGFSYAIRRFGARDIQTMPAVARAALKGQTIFAGFLFILAEVGAPWLSRLLHGPELCAPIRLASIDIPIYAFYLSYVAILNGKSSYTRQSCATTMYALAKIGVILLFVKIGFGVSGALIANIIASAVGLVAGMKLAGRLDKAERFPVLKLVSYAQGTALYRTGFAILLGVDLFSTRAMSCGGENVGYYGAAATIARATYYLFIAIGSAVLPAIARASAENDKNLISRHIRESLRLHLILLVPITAIISGTALGTIDLLYSNKFVPGAQALTILAIAFMLFGLADALSNALIAVGDTRTPIRFVLGSIALAIILNLILVPHMGVLGAAIASTITASISFFALMVICMRRFGTLFSPASTIRIILAGASLMALGRMTSSHGLRLILLYAGLSAAYICVLVILGEITRNDFGRILALISGNGPFRKRCPHTLSLDDAEEYADN